MTKIIVSILFIFLLIGTFTLTAFNKDQNPSYTENAFSVNQLPQNKYSSEIDINYLKSLDLDAPKLQIEQQLENGSNYSRYIASYISDGNKIYGLLTVPLNDAPEGGYSAIVFNHGYIPPAQYVTTQKYVAYVDYLAKNNFVVFKIDMRGHGDSEGIATGSYFSSGYTIDAINALKSLQKLDYINSEKIGMWGHSMAGNLLLRAMLVEPDIKAGVIWAGAVYSYEDFAKYRLNDSSYVRNNQPPSQNDPHYQTTSQDTQLATNVSILRQNSSELNFNDEFWKNISLTQNISNLNSPIQIHHAINDSVVNIGYSRDLSNVLENNNKIYEFYEYPGGGHNIDSPYFEQAMQKTVEFFNTYL